MHGGVPVALVAWPPPDDPGARLSSLPLRAALSVPAWDQEEERRRRIAYVGMTRARSAPALDHGEASATTGSRAHPARSGTRRRGNRAGLSRPSSANGPDLGLAA